MTAEQTAAHLDVLREKGVVLLSGIFPKEPLAAMAQAAGACLQAIAAGRCDPERYRFTPYSQSVLLGALRDYGVEDPMVPLASLPDGLLSQAMDSTVECKREQSWIRKRFAPAHAPPAYHPNQWHQDGGLGVRFPEQPGAAMPMTRLLTCWLPLHACGADSPGLEFIRRPLDSLLHYTELTDEKLRSRFAPEDFWTPALEPGDGILFLNGTLHRTHVRLEMQEDRLSAEYRFFPATEE
ncbi:MAG: hypothetical protein ACRD9L_24115 [Bryobacteraceae bacterium]